MPVLIIKKDGKEEVIARKTKNECLREASRRYPEWKQGKMFNNHNWLGEGENVHKPSGI